MAGTRSQAGDCCCKPRQCGLCSSSRPKSHELGTYFGGGEYHLEESHIFCLDEETEVAWETEPLNSDDYGADCPDVEVMQICLDAWSLTPLHTCFSYNSNCAGDSYQCYNYNGTPQQKIKKEFLIWRNEENPCRWSTDGWIVIDPVEDMHSTPKSCGHASCCGDTGHWGQFDSDVITNGMKIRAEVRASPFCIGEDYSASPTDPFDLQSNAAYVWNLGYPEGTCGRLIEVKIEFHYMDSDGMSGGNLLRNATGKRGYPTQDYELYDYRGGTKWSAWFFPSCGCLPYCYDDEGCEECGETTCFSEEDLPPASIDALSRDRLCNAKDCGTYGCCVQHLELNGTTLGIERCQPCYRPSDYNEQVDTDLRRPPWQTFTSCGGWNVLSGATDECGRGATWSRTGDSSLFSTLVVNSNNGGNHPSELCDIPHPVSCCGSLDGSMCRDAAGNPYDTCWWTNGYNANISPIARGWNVGMGCNWRIVPA